jgi:hypothetical protein
MTLLQLTATLVLTVLFSKATLELLPRLTFARFLGLIGLWTVALALIANRR